MPELDLTAILIIFAALALGGLLKGAIGMGAPLVAVPVMAALVDVRLAVVIMVIPNFVSNLWQIRLYGAQRLANGFTEAFVLGGALGAFLGTLLLVALPTHVLSLLLAGAVAFYVFLRILRPDLKLSFATARKLAFPASAAAGVLQGAAGLSAPVAVSFLNAMRLERPVFIATISFFFAAMSLTQMPTMYWFGMFNWQTLVLGCLAIIPVTIAMPVGEWIARHMSADLFDKAVLTLLCLLALRLFWVAVF